MSWYDEPYRPQIHFSPPRMWMNDPNGLVYFDGEYHLFYQHHPDGSVWGPTHWGHAVSRDLVRWEHLPVALSPDDTGYAFSGSIVVDWQNSCGFGATDLPPMVAVFTRHDDAKARAGRADFQTQHIAYSTDRGRTWTAYDRNPVLANPGLRDFRDPKVIWHAETHQWVMVVAAGDHIRFYGSRDLKQWHHLSAFGEESGAHGGTWECPDLFPLAIEDGGVRWILIVSQVEGTPGGGSGTQYFVGSFDGEQFVSMDPPETVRWLDHGRDNYAGVTWSYAPGAPYSRLFIGWMSNWQYAEAVPTELWRGAMTLPRRLTLVRTGGELQVVARPTELIDVLRRTPTSVSVAGHVHDNLIAMLEPGRAYEADLGFALTDTTANALGFELVNAAGDRYRFGYDRKTGRFFSDRRRAVGSVAAESFAPDVSWKPHRVDASSLRMHVYLDRSSVEIFADDGRFVLTELVFPSEPFERIVLIAEGGQVEHVEGAVYMLESIWPPPDD